MGGFAWEELEAAIAERKKEECDKGMEVEEGTAGLTTEKEEETAAVLAEETVSPKEYEADDVLLEEMIKDAMQDATADMEEEEDTAAPSPPAEEEEVEVADSNETKDDEEPLQPQTEEDTIKPPDESAKRLMTSCWKR